jgi:hypothetical protein
LFPKGSRDRLVLNPETPDLEHELTPNTN